MSSTKLLTWLHISDLHFQSDRNGTEFNNSTAIILRDDLVKFIEKNNLHADFILISGDIMFRNEYRVDITLEFVRKLLEACRCDIDRVIICPGNHEIDRKNETRNILIGQIRSRDKKKQKKYEKVDDISETELELLTAQGYEKFSEMYKLIKGTDYRQYFSTKFTTENATCKIQNINSCLLSKDNKDAGQLRVFNRFITELNNDDNINGLNIAIMHHGVDFLTKEDAREFEVWTQNNYIDAVFCGHSHEPYRTVYGVTSDNIEEFTSGMISHDAKSLQMPTFYYCEYNPFKRVILVNMYWYDTGSKKWGVAIDRHPAFVNGRYSYELRRHVEKSKPPLESIKVPIGTFVFFNLHRESYTRYTEISDKLDYSEELIDLYLSNLEEEHVSILKGKQGSGKTTLSFKLAELLSARLDLDGIFILSNPNDWYTIGKWIDEIRLNNKDFFNNPKFIWVIENMQMSAGLEENIPDVSFWRDDYCILNTQNMDSVEYVNIDVEPVKIIVTKDYFKNCLSTMLGFESIPRKISDKLFEWTGANLALLHSIIKMGNICIDDFESMNLSTLFRSIYDFHFRSTKNEEMRIDTKNKNDVIRALSLLCLDVPLPECLQNQSIQTTLHEFCIRTIKNEVYFEHSTFAEMLLTCICAYFDLNLADVYNSALSWAAENLLEDYLISEIIGQRLNNFLQAFYKHEFLFPHNNNIAQPILWDEKGSIYNLVYNNLCKITPKTWYILLSQDDSDDNNIYQILFGSQLDQDGFMYTVLEDFVSFMKIIGVLNKNNKILLKQNLTSIIELLVEIASREKALPSNIKASTLLSLVMCDLIEQNLRIGFISNIFFKLGINSSLVNRLGLNDDFFTIFIIFLREMKKRSSDVFLAFEDAVGTSGYLLLIEKYATIPNLTSILKYSSIDMKLNLVKELRNHPDKVEAIVNLTINKGVSLETLNLTLREIKKDSSKTLVAFEEAIGVANYLTLIRNLGTIRTLASILQYSSTDMRLSLLKELRNHSEIIETLVDKAIDNGISIGTIGLNLREMKKDTSEALYVFEEVVGASYYLKLIKNLGTIPALISIIQYSSDNMNRDLVAELINQPDIIENLVNKTINNDVSIGSVNLSLRSIKKESPASLCAFEDIMGVSNYLRLISNLGTIPILLGIIRYSSDDMKRKLVTELRRRPQIIVDLTYRTTQNNGASLGMFNFVLYTLKNESPELLDILEKIIGIDGYLKLISNLGSVNILLWILHDSSAKMRKELLEAIRLDDKIADVLVERSIQKKESLATLSLSLRELSKESDDMMKCFESFIGAYGYFRLLNETGTVVDLLGILRYSSDIMRKQFLAEVTMHSEFIEFLIKRTIDRRISLGTICLSIRALKTKSSNSLVEFENVIGAQGYFDLVSALGTITILAKLIEESSENMKENIIREIISHHGIIEILIKRKIDSNTSLGTFNLSLFSLKKESHEVLVAFEECVGAKGYLELISELGTIPITAYILRDSTEAMRLKLISELHKHPEIIKTTIRRTIDNRSSLGTFNFSLETLRYPSDELLTEFENAIGVNGYLELLNELGTIPIAARIIKASTEKMKIDLVLEFRNHSEIVENLIKRTIDDGASLGTLSISICSLIQKSPEALWIFENMIGVDGYIRMLSYTDANAITILRILMCSFLSNELLQQLEANTKIFDAAIEKLKESPTLLKDFNNDIRMQYRSDSERALIKNFLSAHITAIQWLKWMSCGATIEEFIIIMRNLPIKTAKEIAELIKNDDYQPLKCMQTVNSRRERKDQTRIMNVESAANAMNKYCPELYCEVAKLLSI